MTDNILTKTQALLNLYSCDIPRNFANAIIGLFGDSNAVTKEQQRLFGDQQSQQGAKKEQEQPNDQDPQDPNKNPTTNIEDQVNEQNNKVQDTKQNENQGQ